MPALITHRLFGEESIERLPEGIIASEDERAALLQTNAFYTPSPQLRSMMSISKPFQYRFRASARTVSSPPRRRRAVMRHARILVCENKAQLGIMSDRRHVY